MPDDDGFLSRWSRRKIEEKHREEVVLPEPAEDAEAQIEEPGESPVAADPVEAGDAEPERHPAEDIDIDALTKESDFTIFMQKGVPTALRRKALRKLWTSDPVLANLDGLNDYEDMEWTYGIGEVARTDWELGRGFLTDKDLGLEPEEGTREGEGVETSSEEEVPLDEPAAESPAGSPAEPPVDQVAEAEHEDDLPASGEDGSRTT